MAHILLTGTEVLADEIRAGAASSQRYRRKLQRNHEARNILRDDMKIGDLLVSLRLRAKATRIHPYYDAKLKEKDPAKWYMVDVKLVEKFPRLISLRELQQYKNEKLCGLVLLGRGRLSVQPVTPVEYKFITDLAQQDISKT
ncbi:hypothetical protein IWQ60_002794 [Tieghemiomyces parasiticus]|uniref:EVE domain-containing protein n=1 Tax=Tieghemiomyces parasiticus TaxID=78921 RepID=A0A9W8DVC9_9FUNG|nr:hypothetical protein IWQ60_002794 [Tieghemiomyces parasiticus]